MKKFIVLIFAVIAVLSLTACSNTATPAAAWADYETLKYDVEEMSSKEKIGEMEIITERNPADKTVNGKEYTADGKVTFSVKTRDVEMTSVMLFTKYTVIASHKTFTDLNEAGNSYVLDARHSGKYYYYSLNGAEEKRLKVGTSGYTDSEFLYHYVRSHPLTALPSSIKIADPLNHRVATVTCAAYGTDDVTVPFPKPKGVQNVSCTATAIGLTDSPKGKSIIVSFTPDSSEYYVEGLSISASKKIPVKIQENDILYKLTSVNVR